MPTGEIIASATMAALIQGFQAWLAMSRASGMTEEQIVAMMDEQYAIFKQKVSTPLPDPE